MRIFSHIASLGVFLLASGSFALAADFQEQDTYNAVAATPKKHFWSGDWYLTVGAAGFIAPRFEGSNSRVFSATPMFSLGRAGPAARFSSRNDNPAFAFMDTDRFRAGITGKLLFKRDADTSSDLKGMKETKLGGELGGFVEIYPTDWLRVRGEMRQGIRTHKAVVADLAADAFYDVTPTVRISGGPRASFASKDYFNTYYGVEAEQSLESGLDEYNPKGGFKSAGIGAAVTWKTTDKMTTSLFGEYARLQGPAKNSSLVKQRGSRDQFTVGLSATYRFDFSLD